MNNIFRDIISSLRNTLAAKVQTYIEQAPGFLGAIGLMIGGYLIAHLVYRLIIAAEKKLRLEVLAEKVGLSHFLEKHSFKLSSSHVIARSIKAYLIFLFFIEATKIAHFDQVAQFLDDVIAYVPEVIIAVLIMLVGIRMGNVLGGIIKTSFSFTKSTTANVLGIAAKYTILTFAVLAALSQLQIADVLVQTLFIGFIAMLTLAGGLAFGLGGKDVVKELLEAIKKVEIKEYKKGLKEEFKEEVKEAKA